MSGKLSGATASRESTGIRLSLLRLREPRRGELGIFHDTRRNHARENDAEHDNREVLPQVGRHVSAHHPRDRLTEKSRTFGVQKPVLPPLRGYRLEGKLDKTRERFREILYGLSALRLQFGRGKLFRRPPHLLSVYGISRLGRRLCLGRVRDGRFL